MVRGKHLSSVLYPKFVVIVCYVLHIVTHGQSYLKKIMMDVYLYHFFEVIVMPEVHSGSIIEPHKWIFTK